MTGAACSVRRGGPLFMSLLALLALAFVVPGAATAAVFTVNSAADAPDANPGSGGCVTASGACTLRAALEEANHASNPGLDTINFSGFTGNAATSTVTLTNNLFLGDTATIDGGNCGSATNPKPCVGIDASGDDGIVVGNAPGSTITGLAITDAEGESKIAIAAGVNSPNLVVRNSWFGIRLDGTLEANDEGIVTGSDGLVLGGDTAADRNVFARQTGRAVSIAGADNATIRGNYFGTMPDGQTAAGAGNNVAIRVVATPTRTATGTVIGGQDTGTPGTCDAPCNVVSNSAATGIDLDAGGGTLPADGVQVSGNFFDLDRTGSQHLPSTLDSIRVGEAATVTIGGAGTADRNYMAGSVAAGAAPDLVVRGNFIGLNASGTQRMSSGGFVNLGPSIASPVVRDNRVTNGISVVGNGADIRGNTVGIGTNGQNVGGGNGILVLGDGSTIGGVDADANVIGNSSFGISVQGSNNLVPRNLVGVDGEGQAHPNSGFGIQVQGGDANVIGNPTGPGNVISNSDRDAIQLGSDGSDRNTLASNTGANNGSGPNDAFIDLLDLGVGGEGPGNPATGPNNAIQAPTVSAVSEAGASGTVPPGLANYTIQAFVTNQANGTARAFVGQATVAAGASWAVAFAQPILNGECIQVTVTGEAGDTSELSNQLCDAESPPSAPNTTLDPFPDLTNDPTPTFSFSANQDVKRFECRIYPASDSPPAFQTCAQAADDEQKVSFTAAPLGPDGEYRFELQAIDLNDNVEVNLKSTTFTLDTTPPSLAITSGPGEGDTTTDHLPLFGFSTDGQSVQCRFDGQAFGPCLGVDSHQPAAPLADGAHSFSVRASDAAGNQSAVATRTFTVTTPPPDGGGTIPPPDGGGGDGVADTDAPETKLRGLRGVTTDRTPTFRFRAIEPLLLRSTLQTGGVRFQCRLDRGRFRGCTSPKTLKKLDFGKHVFEVRAIDAAGNVDPTPARRRFAVREEAP
jgi:CSLREA domain-containing protein